MAEQAVQTPATKQAFESALLAAKFRGRIDLEDFAAQNEKAAAASDSDLQSMTEKLNEDLPKQEKKATPPSETTLALWRHTLAEAGRLSLIAPGMVAQYQHRAGTAHTEEHYLQLIEELETKMPEKK